MFNAGCRTTAMGIMPHTDVDKALELALGLDIPYWPQLPNVSFFEDMYAQSSQNIPGILVDPEEHRIRFDTVRFQEEIGVYSEAIEEPDFFALSPAYSSVYHRFLSLDLSRYAAIRGQLVGPVSFGFKVFDESDRPIIYNDDVRSILFEFFARKASVQYTELKEKNGNAFVWFDEPGFGWVFSSLTGYDDVRAKRDYRDFLQGMKGPRALHLCANVNLPFLLDLGIDLLSFDAYQLERLPGEYARSVASFMGGGGVISWGIVPSDSDSLSRETPDSLMGLLYSYWDAISQASGVTRVQVAEHSLLAPARCCLKNIGMVGAAGEETCDIIFGDGRDRSVEERVVDQAFEVLQELSWNVRRELALN